MKRILLLGLCMVILLASLVSAESLSIDLEGNIIFSSDNEECVTDPPFINKIIKGCKIENNSICEDGENLIIDSDCKPYFDDLKTGKVFTYMWFLRFMLLLSLVMFLRKDINFPIIVLFIIILLAANGAFGDLSFDSNTDIDQTNINQIVINETTEEVQIVSKPNLLKEDFKDFGGLVMPNHPYLGGIALIILFYLFAIYLPNRRS